MKWRSARTVVRLRAGVEDDTVILWDTATGTRKATLTDHDGWVNEVAFSPDGRTLASGSYDGTVMLWDTATGTRKATLTGHDGGVINVAFSPDGLTLASEAGDSTVILWSIGWRSRD